MTEILVLAVEYYNFWIIFSLGVGCSKSHADNWIAHQDDFNQLLSNLNQNAETNDEEKSAEEKNKVQSLEVKSKTSRSRVQ